MGRKKVNENYFTNIEEDAVLNYIASNSKDEKNEIYESILRRPLEKMTRSILLTYPIFWGSYEEREIINNGLSHVLENMVKYNPNKPLKSGKKPTAYSYLGTIIRNYFRHWSKTNYGLSLSHLNFEDYAKDVYHDDKNIFEMNLDLDGNKNETIYVELFENIIDNLRFRLENVEMKSNDYVVGLGLIRIFENWEILFTEESPENNLDISISGKYLKNKIYLILIESTGLNLKDIRFSLKNFREIYAFEKKCLFEELN